MADSCATGRTVACMRDPRPIGSEPATTSPRVPTISRVRRVHGIARRPTHVDLCDRGPVWAEKATENVRKWATCHEYSWADSLFDNGWARSYENYKLAQNAERDDCLVTEMHRCCLLAKTDLFPILFSFFYLMRNKNKNK